MKKLEAQLNKLWNRIKELEMTEEDIGYLNMKGFLYSVGRLNILQVIAILTDYATEKGITLTEILNILED